MIEAGNPSPSSSTTTNVPPQPSNAVAPTSVFGGNGDVECGLQQMHDTKDVEIPGDGLKKASSFEGILNAQSGNESHEVQIELSAVNDEGTSPNPSGLEQSATLQSADPLDPNKKIGKDPDSTKLNDTEPYRTRLWDVITNFPYMGCTAFGGPAMAITLLQDRFVNKKKWLDEPMFKELFALCQGFPGPTQGLMSVALGTLRAGLLGGIVALILYSLPGFTIMTIFGIISYLYFDTTQVGVPDWMTGLAPAAISLLFLAAWKLGKQHCLSSKLKTALGTLSACGTLLVTGDARVDQRWAALMFPAFLIVGGTVTYLDSKRKGREGLYYTAKPPSVNDKDLKRKINISKPCGLFIIALWLIILITFVVLRGQNQLNSLGNLFESLFRVGSMIFGGGYVVLPMLYEEDICPPNQFFQGFALVQAMPGPLFNFSAFLGAVSNFIPGAFVGAIGLFAPGTMLLLGMFPFWTTLRVIPGYRAFTAGVSATAIGFVVAACIQLWEIAVLNAADAVVFLCTGTAVQFFNVPIPISIFGGALFGFILSPTCIGIGQQQYCLAEFQSLNRSIPLNAAAIG